MFEPNQISSRTLIIRENKVFVNSARILLENLVTDEYCSYITSNFENYEVILQALKEQFTNIECQGALYMKCNSSVMLALSPTILLGSFVLRKLFRF